MRNKNKETYAKSHIVRHYTKLSLLQPAEKTILALLQDRLSTMKMLDIGIGGGRTTKHFSPLVKEYIGIDYSAEMIAACQQRFINSSHNIFLEVADARKMDKFADNSFDFILFSFNGIDYVDHCDRLNILQEVKRVGKPGCYFFFSSHNLQSIANEFDYKKQISLNPFKTYVNLAMFALLKLFNFSITGKQLRNADHLIIRDESHNFRLQTYYIRPEVQIKQLTPHFNNIEIYSWQTGQKILDSSDRYLNYDMWLYYFCNIN